MTYMTDNLGSMPPSDKMLNTTGVPIRSGLYNKDISDLWSYAKKLNTQKLDKLFAGDGITIENGIISASSSSSVTSSDDSLTVTPTVTSGNTTYDLSITAPVPVDKGGTGVTSLTGLVKGNGAGAFTSAIAGADYLAPHSTAGNAAKLATPRNLQIDLSSENPETFDGSADATSIGVKNILAQLNGGTGLSSFQPNVDYSPANAESTAVSDLNDLGTGKFLIPSTQVVANAPYTGYSYFVEDFNYNNQEEIQIAYPVGTSMFPLFRTKFNGTWVAWEDFTLGGLESALMLTSPTGTIDIEQVSGGYTLDVSAIVPSINIFTSLPAFVFAGSETSALDGTATTEITATRGNGAISVSVGTITGLPTGLTATITNNNTNQATVTFTADTTLTTLNGQVTIPVTAAGSSQNVSFAYAVALQGSGSSSSIAINLSSEAVVFPASPSAAISGTTSTDVTAVQGTTPIPVTIGTLSGLPLGMTYSVQNNGTTDATIIFSVTPNLTTSGGGVIIPVTAAGVTQNKVFSYALAFQGQDGQDGSSAYTIILTNENDTFPATSNGHAIAGTTTTTPVAYLGNVAQSITVGTITGLPTGMTASIVNNNTVAPLITFTVTTDLISISGNVTVPLTVNGVAFTRQFSYSLVAAGQNGASGTGLSLNPSSFNFLANLSITSAGSVMKAAPTSVPIYITASNNGVSDVIDSLTISTPLPTGMTVNYSGIGSSIVIATLTVSNSMVTPNGTLTFDATVGSTTLSTVFSYSLAINRLNVNSLSVLTEKAGDLTAGSITNNFDYIDTYGERWIGSSAIKNNEFYINAINSTMTGTTAIPVSGTTQYMLSTSVVSPPTGTWQSTVPNLNGISANTFLWQQESITYSDGTTINNYSAINPSLNVTSEVTTYNVSSDPINPPTTTWQSAPISPITAPNIFAWDRHIVYYSGAIPSVTYYTVRYYGNYVPAGVISTISPTLGITTKYFDNYFNPNFGIATTGQQTTAYGTSANGIISVGTDYTPSLNEANTIAAKNTSLAQGSTNATGTVTSYNTFYTSSGELSNSGLVIASGFSASSDYYWKMATVTGTDFSGNIYYRRAMGVLYINVAGIHTPSSMPAGTWATVATLPETVEFDTVTTAWARGSIQWGLQIDTTGAIEVNPSAAVSSSQTVYGQFSIPVNPI